MTKVGRYAIGTSTPLESNKSQPDKLSERGEGQAIVVPSIRCERRINRDDVSGQTRFLRLWCWSRLQRPRVDQEGKRRFHHGPQDTNNLLQEAEYMTASVPKRRTCDFSLTSAAGPYMTNSIRGFFETER
jgi:hypothetical protein